MNNNAAIEQEIQENYKHNFIVNYFDGTFFWLGASFFAYQTILPVYIAHLTDSKFAIALLSTILATGWLFPQLFTANWTQNLPLKKFAPVNIGLWTERIPLVLLVPAALSAIYSYKLALVLSFIMVAWHIIGAGVVAVGWQDLIAKVIPQKRRGIFFGITNFTGRLTGLLGAVTVAWLLGRFPFPYGYAYAFGAGAFFVMLSWGFLALTREPYVPPQKPATNNRTFFKTLPGIIRADSNFKHYLITQIFMTAGGMSIGFLAVYAVQKWNLPDSQAGTFTIAALLGQVVSNLVFGWLSDRKGHKIILEMSVVAVILSRGIAAFAPAETWFLVVFFLAGIADGGFFMSGIMIIFEFCAPEIRPTYIGLNNTFSGAFGALMPMIGGLLVTGVGYQVMFAISTAIVLIGFLLLRFWVKEPRLSQITG